MKSPKKSSTHARLRPCRTPAGKKRSVLAKRARSRETFSRPWQGVVFRGDGDYAGNEFIIGSGSSALLVRYHAGKRHLTDHDQLTLEWSGAYRRYHAAMMRTLLVGEAHRDHVDMHRACEEALLACEQAVRAGNPMGDVYQAQAEVMDAGGYEAHRMRACGYGMSAIYNPLWVDPPMFYEGNPLIMKAGNLFFFT